MHYSSTDVNSTSDSLPSRRDAIKVLSARCGKRANRRRARLSPGTMTTRQAGKTRFFTQDEAQLVEAISEQIIPADKDPGAKDARVVIIHRQAVGRTRMHNTRKRIDEVSAPCRKRALSSSASLSKLSLGTTKRKSWPRLKRDELRGKFGNRPAARSSSISYWNTPNRASTAVRSTAETTITSASKCSVWTTIIPRFQSEVRASHSSVRQADPNFANFERNRTVPNRHVNAIVVGSGAGGGVVAKELAVAGLTVVLFERGSWASYKTHGDDELMSQRTTVLGNGYGPDDRNYRRVVVEPDGSTRIVRPSEGAYNNVAACVGSGTVVYGAMGWRFMPQDFKMRSTYGPLAGSTVEDWPISYDDLEPCYEKAEWEIGVSGDDNRNPFAPPRKKPQPMPALPYTTEAHMLEAAAKRLGWHPFPIPMLRNSVPYNGRNACVRTG